MKRIDITLSQLEALVAVLRHGGFARAAGKLGMSQSAVSHAVATLEHQLGMQVVARTRGAIAPRPAALRLVEHAEAALAAIDRLRSEAAEVSARGSGRLRLGTFGSTSISLVPGLLGAWQRSHPQVEVVLFTGHAAQLRDWVREGIVDASFIELPERELEVVAAIEDPLLAVLPKRAPWTSRRHVTLAELDGDAVLLSQYGCERLIDAAYQAAGRARRHDRVVQDMSTLLAMVREGLGITLVPRLALPRRLDGVVALPLRPLRARRMGLAVHATRSRPAMLSRFLELAAHHLKHAGRAHG